MQAGVVRSVEIASNLNAVEWRVSRAMDTIDLLRKTHKPAPAIIGSLQGTSLGHIV